MVFLNSNFCLLDFRALCASRGYNKRLLADCLSKTQVRAKPKGDVYGLKPAQRRKVK